ncbi:MAG: hypothetical protein WC479_10955 [Candidatus Izemoplasmatales bacterium]|jgi:hypothetical protein
MSVVLTVQRNVKLDSEQYNTSSEDYTGTSGDKISVAVPASSTNWPLPGWGGFHAADLQAIWFTSDVACTLTFGTAATAHYPITLLAGGTFLWTNTDGGANPFGTDDITDLEITCTAAANIIGRTCVG